MSADPTPPCVANETTVDTTVRLARQLDHITLIAEFEMPFRFTMRWENR